MIKRTTLENREAWLDARKHTIGGSDAAAIVGASPYKTNIALWEEKTGRQNCPDISDNEAVRYGVSAEDHLRALFALDFPELEVFYTANNFWTNSEYPFAHCSLDGWLTDQSGRFGILEIKTSTIQGAAMKAKWEKRIPENYYIQLLHYLLVTGADFAILKAKLIYRIEGEEPFAHIRHYRIEREEVKEDIAFLEEAEREFAEHLKNDTPPALTLPEI